MVDTDFVADSDDDLLDSSGLSDLELEGALDFLDFDLDRVRDVLCSRVFST